MNIGLANELKMPIAVSLQGAVDKKGALEEKQRARGWQQGRLIGNPAGGAAPIALSGRARGAHVNRVVHPRYSS